MGRKHQYYLCCDLSTLSGIDAEMERDARRSEENLENLRTMTIAVLGKVGIPLLCGSPVVLLVQTILLDLTHHINAETIGIPL